MKAQMFNYAYWEKETNPFVLAKKYNSLLTNSKFKILEKCCYHFKPQGYTALYLLSESHLAIHTFPEENKTYIELSSCVENPFNNFIKNLKQTNTEIITEYIAKKD